MKAPLFRPSGRSLLELLVAIIIIVLLAALTFPLAGHFIRKASYVGCLNNMKSLHAGFSSYLADHQMIWPQVPEGLERKGQDGDMLAKFWHDQLEDYGVTKKTWLCPADADLKKVTEEQDLHASTYTVTEFDDQPNRAYQWAGQPWVIEAGDMHGVGKGPNILFPDGRVEYGISLMQR